MKFSYFESVTNYQIFLNFFQCYKPSVCVTDKKWKLLQYPDNVCSHFSNYKNNNHFSNCKNNNNKSDVGLNYFQLLRMLDSFNEFQGSKLVLE